MYFERKSSPKYLVGDLIIICVDIYYKFIYYIYLLPLSFLQNI